MDTAQEIKNRLSIIDVVRDYGTLVPAGTGGNFKMLCPFHDDHHPSMIVSESKGIAWCFSCNSGGDIFSFVQKIENCSFPEAVQILAEKAGVHMKEYKAPDPKKQEEKEREYNILEEATAFFEKQLEKNERAKKSVKDRKIPENILKKFHVGYAPESGHSLEKYLLEKGYSRKEMTNAGLLSLNHKGETQDKFRTRIMFPIWNAVGRICAFGGRYIGDYENAPKYLNSPETSVYKKSKILYGLHAAKNAIKEKGFTLLVEGYYDVLACHSAGIENVVAVSGTAFTAEHARILARYGNGVALALDVDVAGQAAARKAAILCLQKNEKVEVISIPGGKDPDEAVRENKEEFLQAVKNRENAIDAFLKRSFLHRNPKSLGDKKIILDELLPVLYALKRDIERDYYMQILAEKLSTHVQVIHQEYKNITKYMNRQDAPEKKKRERQGKLEHILSLVLAFPEMFKEIQKHLLIDLLPQTTEKKFYNILITNYNIAGVLSPKKIWEKISPEESEKWCVAALEAEEQYKNFSEIVRQEECKKIVFELNKECIEQKIQELSQKLKDSPQDTPEIIIQLSELTKLLHTFHTS